MDKLHEILEYSVGNFTVGKILGAVVAFVICYLLMRLIRRLFDRLLARFSLDATLQKILKAVVRLILWFVTAMIVIETLGVSVTSMLAAFSVVGLAASLAVQDSLSNCAGGIMILVTKPFKIGDYIEIDDVSGTVEMIHLIHTRITTVDNKMIYVPNSKIIAAKIVNYTTQEKRRVDWKSPHLMMRRWRRSARHCSRRWTRSVCLKIRLRRLLPPCFPMTTAVFAMLCAHGSKPPRIGTHVSHCLHKSKRNLTHGMWK